MLSQTLRTLAADGLARRRVEPTVPPQVYYGLTDLGRSLDGLCLLIGGPVGMSGLTRLLNIGRPSLSGLVDRVEQRGLISRVQDTTDRRANQMVLTPRGRRTAARWHRRIARDWTVTG